MKGSELVKDSHLCVFLCIFFYHSFHFSHFLFMSELLEDRGCELYKHYLLVSAFS